MNQSDTLAARPQHLTPEEIKDPYLVLHELFELDHLSGIRELLWEFFKTAVTGNYTHELNRQDRFFLVTLYEHLEKLIEAAHIIDRSRREEKPTYRTYPFHEANLQPDNLNKLAGDKITPEQLQAVIEKVVQITNAEKVFLAGLTINSEGQVWYDILVILPEQAPKQYKEYNDQIEAQCKPYGWVLSRTTRIPDLYKKLAKGDIFYTSTCQPQRMVYDIGRRPIPVYPQLNIPSIKVKARDIFTELFELAKSFLDGAEHFATTEQRRPAAFMLHQATEHALRALLEPFATHTAYGHDLQLLLRQCAPIAPELNRVFPNNTPEEKHLFDQLGFAYVATRYRSNYEISQTEVMILLDRVNTLQTEVLQFFEEKLIAFDMLTSQTGLS